MVGVIILILASIIAIKWPHLNIAKYIAIPAALVSIIGIVLTIFNNPNISIPNRTKSFKYGDNIVKVQRFDTIEHIYSKVTYYKLKHIGVHIAKPVKVNSKDYRGLVIIDKKNGTITKN